MKVQVLDVAELLDELRHDAERIRHNTVRVRIDRTPEQDEAISFEVGVWVTAIVNDGQNRPDHLLEFIEFCGRDTKHNDNAGTQRAREVKRAVEQLAEECKLTVRPGKLEFF